MSGKRLLSIFLAMIFVLSTAVTTSMFATAQTIDELWSKDSNVSDITGNEEDGYDFSIPAGNMVRYQPSFLLKDTKLQFSYDAGTESWGYISFYAEGGTSYLPGYEEQLQNKKIDLLLKVTEDGGVKKLTINRWDGADTPLMKEAVDLQGVHTLEFILHAGKWYLCLDGKLQDNVDISELFENQIDTPVSVRFGGYNNPNNYSNVKVIGHSEWTPTTQTTVTAQADGAYTIYGINGGDGTAVTHNAYDLDLTRVQLNTGDFQNGDWSYFGVADTQNWGSAGKLGGLPMLLHQDGARLRITAFVNGGEKSVAEIDNFDFTANHTMGWSYDAGSDSWSFVVDGKEFANSEMSDALKGMNTKNMYYRLGAGIGGTAKTFTNVKVLENYWTTNGGMKSSGSLENGFVLTTQGYARGSYKLPVDLENQDLKFKVDDMQDGAWFYFGVANNTADYGLDGKNEMNTRCGFIMERQENGTKMKLQFHKADDSWNYDLIGVIDFDWSAQHTIGFARGVSCGNSAHENCWYILLDGVLYENRDCLSDYVDAFSGSAYIKLGSNGSSQTSVKVVDREGGNYRWFTNDSTVSITGTDMGGYTITNTNATFTSYRTKFDVTKTSIKMQLNDIASVGWGWLAVSADPDYFEKLSSPSLTDGRGAIEFILQNENGALKVDVWVNGVVNILTIPNFDFNSVHEFGFVKNGDSLQLRVDNAVSDNDLSALMPFAQNGAYYCLSCQKGGNFVVNNITFPAASEIPAATVSSNAYSVNGNVISRVAAGTDAADFTNGISSAYSVRVMKDGAQVAQGNMATGMQVVLTDIAGKTVNTYDVAVTGDVNGDGQVDVLDAVQVRRQIASLLEPTAAQNAAMDVTGDGPVTAEDLMALKAVILNR